jgi:hypothetical protein
VIYGLLAIALLANVAALVGIAAWYRRQNDAILADLRESRADWLEARIDLHQERTAHQHALKTLARKERQAADDRIMALVEKFRADLDAHDAAFCCLPTLSAASNVTPSDGPAPIYDELRGVVVPIGKKVRR